MTRILLPIHAVTDFGCLVICLACFLGQVPLAKAGHGCLEIRQGYFWDPALRDYFIARGFAYQTFNPPVGANQSLDQLAYDLTEFKRMHANSARVEMVWNQVEHTPGVFDWSKVDFLVAKADELGIRLFVLIGFQYTPDWFPEAWKAVNDIGGSSVVVNYEHPEARQAYSNYVFQVTRRYKDSSAIGAWILGNEYAYFDLWNTDRHFLGYDPISQASFRNYLASIYATNIARLNANWSTAFPNFESVRMPASYPPNRDNGGYFDLIQWRKKSIGDYVAVGAVAARNADINHLLSYSMVGGVFSGLDELNTCEDAKTIVARCAASSAPLDFWSVNNYSPASLGSELRSSDFGIAKYQAQSGLPVLVTETGHSSTDDLNTEEPQRYGKALPTQVWEALVSGALGVQIFTWNDRDMFAGPFQREKGFGVVNQNRTPKEAVYGNIVATFRRLANLNLSALLGGSANPPPDILYFWSRNADMVWPRANMENAMLWGALKRLGYQPGMIDEEQLASGAATQGQALLLSRCWMMDPAQLDFIATNLIPAGIHVHADADLPGQFTPYHKANPAWTERMNSLFGVNVTQAAPGLDSGATNMTFGTLFFAGLTNLGSIAPSYADQIATWKLWHRIPINSGTVVSHTGLNGTQTATTALQINNLGKAKTAVNTFALGDIENSNPSDSPQHKWDFRHTWLRAIYRDWFGLLPRIELSGTGADHVFPDYRMCSNGSVLVALLNGDTNTASVTVTATNILAGKTVENLTTGGTIEHNSDGVVNVSMAGDDYVLLYAYDSANGVDQSLLNSSPNKLWIADAPAAVWPTGSNWMITVGYDLRDPNLTLMAGFERVLGPNLVLSLAPASPVSGRGTLTIPLVIPDADLNNSWYLSSRDGGEYVFHAWVVKNGTPLADTYVPVRLLWPVRPMSLPGTVVAGVAYPVTIEWQELPSWLPSEGSAPLDRAILWQPYLASLQYYKVVLELHSAGQVVVVQEFLANTGTGQHTFKVTVPTHATGPFSWTAYLQTAPDASIDMLDSFEDRDTGAESDTPGPPLFAPWQLATYAENTKAQGQMYLNAGVGMGGSEGNQSVFIVVTNPPTVGAFSGAFLYYTYPRPWALPHDELQWTNDTFSFDFNETNRLDCILEMQVKDTRGGVLNFTKRYTPGADGWDRIQASLDRFTVPSWAGQFDSEHVSQLILNIQLLDTNAQYLGFLDNVRFVGSKTTNQTVAPMDLWDNYDNRDATSGIEGWAALAPWSTYVYPPPNEREFDRGIARNQGLKGSQAAMMIVTNPAAIGPISSFGLYRSFTNTWALPVDTNQWANYVLCYSFREANWRRCSIEIQVKSGVNNWIEFTRIYTPGPDGWDTIRAPLSQFLQPAGIGLFDPSNVEGIALNVRLLESNAIYVGFFDNAFFDAPDTIVPTGVRFGIYESGNDSTADPGIFSIQSIQHGPGGHMVLSWLAHSNRLYSAEYQDRSLDPGARFLPLPPLTGMSLPTNGLLSATDTNAPSSPIRFYRLRAQPR